MFSGNRFKKQFKFLPKSEYILPICFLGLSGVSLFNFLLLFFLSFRVNQLAKQQVTFVQLVNGQSIPVIEQDGLYRHPEVIKNLVRNWATLTFNWDGKILGTKEIDKGYDIGKGKRVTTNAYFASFLIQTGNRGFRQAALQTLSALTPTEVYNGKYRSNIIISFISEPRQIKQGMWEVDLISTRILMNSLGRPEEEIDFNRTITLKTTDIPNPPIPSASLLEQQIYQLKLGGLEITKMVDFQAR